MSNEVSPSERASGECYIHGLDPVSGPTGNLDKLASKLNYESVGRSRAVEQILDVQIFKLEIKGATRRSEVEPSFELYLKSLILGGYKLFKVTS